KNILFVFPALVFGSQLFNPELLARVVLCSCLLMVISGSVYIINDLADLEADRAHPQKKSRPLAAGIVSTQVAWLAAVLLPTLALAAAYSLHQGLFWVLLLYFVLQVAYSFSLKHIVLLDILVVAAGFVLRVLAGGVVIEVQLSPWLYTSAGLLALFLVIGKRRQEFSTLGEAAASVRRVYAHYNLALLDDMLRIVTTSTLITYILYTVEARTMVRNGENLGLLTVPIVIYGLLRYLYLIHVRKEGSAPDEILLTDRPLQATITVTALAYFVIIYLL
ncbi:MAG: decaprenyl-phosphate phosphoribosyltransferase, partial [Chloroflexi bacterium]|nr:decaprenyl-phosphate phosphoribosyltransferase [Chloroflexota bacterium]